MIRLAYFNATEEIRKKEAEEKGVQYFTGLPITTAAIVFPLVLILHFYIHFDFSIVYFIVLLIMAMLYLGGFKIRKPGRVGLLLQVLIGAAEFIMIVCILLSNFI